MYIYMSRKIPIKIYTYIFVICVHEVYLFIYVFIGSVATYMELSKAAFG